MTKKPRRTLTLAKYGLSIALHVAVVAGAVLAPKTTKSTVVAISLSETRKPPRKEEETPPPPPPPPPPPAVKAKSAPVPVAVADSKPTPATPSTDPTPPTPNGAPDGFADLGLMMGNGAGGMAVPVGARPVAESPQRETTRKVRALAAVREDACDEPIVKAKLRGTVVKPIYPPPANAAQIEGVVRVEMTIDEQGNVIAAKVLKGLGYGCDEAAILAAKQMTFEPGTKCGKAAVTKLTVGMRFNLEQ